MIPDVGSDLETWPGRLDVLRRHAIDDDELLPARGTRDDPDVSPGHPEGVRDEPDEGVVGGSLHGRRADPRTKDAVDDPVDPVSRSPRREADGKADVGGSQDLRRRATACRGRG